MSKLLLALLLAPAAYVVRGFGYYQVDQAPGWPFLEGSQELTCSEGDFGIIYGPMPLPCPSLDAQSVVDRV